MQHSTPSCPSCGHEIDTWMTFCPGCGARQETTLHQGIQSDIRLATVLFGDVVGFTALSERLSPEDVTDLMNRCFEIISRPIVAHGGTIDKYVGDAIMARFGAPEAHEDDPLRAINAALEMQRDILTLRDDTRASQGPLLLMRIGINTGEVMAGIIGSSALRQFTLMGNTVNLASRLEHVARPGTVLVGETTYRLARDFFDFRPLPPMEIRGQSDLVHAYVPLKRVSRDSPRLNTEARFVGREPELAILTDGLEHARQGTGRIVAVVGEPGVGKTRLVDEFLRRHGDQPLNLVRAAATSLGQSAPYSLLASFVRSLALGHTSGDEVDRTLLRDRLLVLLPESSVAEAVNVLAEVVGVSGPASPGSALPDTRVRHATLINVLTALVEVQSQHAPLVLVLEDLHWADDASLDVLNRVMLDIEGRPVLAVTTCRTEFVAPWREAPFHDLIPVRELPEDSSHALAVELLGATSIPADLAALLVGRSGGNPFFLEQILTTLIESGALRRRSGQWEMVDGTDIPAIPVTVHGLLRARVDRLPRSARAVLDVAAVIGTAIPHPLLASVLAGHADLEADLDLLRQNEILLPFRSQPRREYAFRHALTREVVYRGLIGSRRRALHERVAQAIESVGDTATSEDIALLALHYAESQNRVKGLRYALAAAERAAELYANQDAAHHLEFALRLLDPTQEEECLLEPELLERLGDVHESMADFVKAREYFQRARDRQTDARHVARLWRKSAGAARVASQYAEAAEEYRRAEDALVEIDDPNERALILLARAGMDQARGSLDRAWQTYLHVLSFVDRLDEPTSALLYLELGGIERERGHLRSATGYFASVAEIWGRSGSLDQQSRVLSAQADVALHTGELAVGLRHLESQLEIHRRMLDRQGIARALLRIGQVLRTMGDLETAESTLAEAADLAGSMGDRTLSTACRLQRGLALFERGDLDSAKSDLDGAYDAFKQMRNWRGVAQSSIARASLLRVRGDPKAARGALRNGAELAAQMRDPRLQIEAAIEDAHLERQAGQVERMMASARDALAMSREFGDPVLEALSEHVVGLALMQQGNRKAGCDHLQVSSVSLRRVGAALAAARVIMELAGILGEDERTAESVTALMAFASQSFEKAGVRSHVPGADTII